MLEVFIFFPINLISIKFAGVFFMLHCDEGFDLPDNLETIWIFISLIFIFSKKKTFLFTINSTYLINTDKNQRVPNLMSKYSY
jgi:hypothetical protein